MPCQILSSQNQSPITKSKPRLKKTQKNQIPRIPQFPQSPYDLSVPPQMEIYLFALQCHVRYSPHAKLRYVEPANQDTTLRAFFYITYCYCCSGYVLKSFWLQNFYLLYTANNLIVRFLDLNKNHVTRNSNFC